MASIERRFTAEGGGLQFSVPVDVCFLAIFVSSLYDCMWLLPVVLRLRVRPPATSPARRPPALPQDPPAAMVGMVPYREGKGEMSRGGVTAYSTEMRFAIRFEASIIVKLTMCPRPRAN